MCSSASGCLRVYSVTKAIPSTCNNHPSVPARATDSVRNISSDVIGCLPAFVAIWITHGGDGQTDRGVESAPIGRSLHLTHSHNLRRRARQHFLDVIGPVL